MQPRFEPGKPLPIDWAEMSRVDEEARVHQIASPLFMDVPELDESDSLMKDIPLASKNNSEELNDELLAAVDEILDS